MSLRLRNLGLNTLADPTGPESITPDDRRDEVATIFTRGG